MFRHCDRSRIQCKSFALVLYVCWAGKWVAQLKGCAASRRRPTHECADDGLTVLCRVPNQPKSVSYKKSMLFRGPFHSGGHRFCLDWHFPADTRRFLQQQDYASTELVYWATSLGRSPFCNWRVSPSSELLHSQMWLHRFRVISLYHYALTQ